MIDTDIVEANGAVIPRVGLGTFGLSDEACTEAVEAALAAGYRHLDTATMYGNEAEVGQGLNASGLARDAVFVTTKVWRDDIDEGALQRSVEGSLKRLGLSEVDLLLIHWPNDAVPLARSTAALCDVRRRGLARNIGVSNYPVAMLEETLRLATEPLAANQVEHHPYLDQTRLLETCRRHGMALTSYSPLGRAGVLADPTIGRIAARHGREPAKVVLRWHLQHPGVVAIPKSGTPARIAANLDVFGFALSEAEMAEISGLARPGGRFIDPGFAPAWD